MIYGKCEQCHKLSFYPRIRTLHFPFIPEIKTIHSEKKICRSCAKKTELMIRRTHKQIRPPVWFIIKFYIIKSFYIIKQYVNKMQSR